MGNLSADERAALDELKGVLRRDFPLVELRLFGSKARGDANSESDIDVVVVLREHNWQTDLKVYGACFDIGLEHDVLIQPVVFSVEEFHSRRTQVTPFYRAVAREGIAL